MRLELCKVHITGLQFSPEGEATKVENGVLYVNVNELQKLILNDENIKAVEIELARPGEDVRITPVKDVIEPRVKLSGGGGVFPGMVSKMDMVGCGRTLALCGAAVVTCGKIVGFQEGIIDMNGPGADYSPFSALFNICLVIEPIAGLKQYDYETSARLAGFKAAAYLAEAVKDVEPDEISVYETKPMLESIAEFPGLPKVGYVYMLQTQGLLHDTYLYGADAKRIIPTLLYPTEVMDGAIVSGNCVSACDKNTTYHHQNNAVINDLYERHGKDLNFIGVVITNETVFLADKTRSSDQTAKLCKFLGFDAVIITQEGFGNPDTDLIMNCKKIEAEGIKTVIITDEYAGRDGKSQSLADADVSADACVTGGNANEIIKLPPMKKIIGMLDYTDKIAGGFSGSLKPDGSIEAELQVIVGATNEIGFNRMTAVGY